MKVVANLYGMYFIVIYLIYLPKLGYWLFSALHICLKQGDLCVLFIWTTDIELAKKPIRASSLVFFFAINLLSGFLEGYLNSISVITGFFFWHLND